MQGLDTSCACHIILRESINMTRIGTHTQTNPFPHSRPNKGFTNWNTAFWVLQEHLGRSRSRSAGRQPGSRRQGCAAGRPCQPCAAVCGCRRRARAPCPASPPAALPLTCSRAQCTPFTTSRAAQARCPRHVPGSGALLRSWSSVGPRLYIERPYFAEALGR